MMRSRQLARAFWWVLLLAAALISAIPGEARPRDHHRKLRLASEGNGVEGQFIVRMKAEILDENEEANLRSGTAQSISSSALHDKLLGLGLEHAVVTRTFTAGSFHGFTVTNLVHDDDLDRLLNHENVLLVEQDQQLQTYNNQFNPPWGLDRINQPDAALDNRFDYDYTGLGVTVFVVDTGGLLNHEDFGGRLTCGFTAFSETDDSDCADDDGHGTHVSGKCN